MKILRDADRFHFDGDHQAFADWMLSVVDSSPDKLAVFPMPVGADDSDEEIDSVEDIVRRAYDLAKDERPDLGVKVLHALDAHNGAPESRLLVVIHQHQWVGGQCVNGCPDTRKEG